MLLAVFAGDTVAYGVGSAVGRHKLAPVLSPGKTWEGFVAGAAAAIFVIFLRALRRQQEFLSIWQALLLGAIDRRRRGARRPVRVARSSATCSVKDTGRLLGGHGGMLDRHRLAALRGDRGLSTCSWPSRSS